ncbi:MAG: exonuclease domain-containing protein [Porticoccaceae bacterium]
MQLNWLDTATPDSLSPGFPEKMVLLDCETTGGKAPYHRIIEIGLLVVEEGRLVEKWQTFVDPRVPLPPFIQRLTGISPGMVAGAPEFSDIAEELLSKLEGRTLVAHNARFDYSFLKNEFERAGISYNAKPLCSVKFSRNLYPQFKRHGLSQIIERFGLSIENRHRALDDAEMIYKFFQKSSALFSEDEIAATCKTLLKRPSLPTLLNAKEVEKLPTSAGVYYFYDAKGALLYIGKSVHIRNRVLSHFSSDHKNPKDLQMSTKIAHIDFEQTPSDFGAQIRESNQIKAQSPIYNRRLRKVKKLFQFRSTEDSQGYLRLNIEPVETEDTAVEQQFGLFRSPRQASKKMQQLADQYFLCHKLLGLEGERANQKPCFRSQLKKCFGACHGAEPAVIYNERMTAALKNYQIKLWPYAGPILVEERDPQNPDQVAFHIIDRWRYIAKLALIEDIYDLGYQLRDLSSPPPEPDQISGDRDETDDRFDLDIYFILVRFMVDQEKIKMNNLKLWDLVAS